MTDNTAAIAEIGYLMWCFNQGYGLAEDRAILTGGNWLLTDDSQLHEDDVRDKYQLLDLAADLYAAVAPVIALEVERNVRPEIENNLRDRLRTQMASMPYRHSPGGVRLLERDPVLDALYAEQDGTCTYCGGVGCKACDARVALRDGES